MVVIVLEGLTDVMATCGAWVVVSPFKMFDEFQSKSSYEITLSFDSCSVKTTFDVT